MRHQPSGRRFPRPSKRREKRLLDRLNLKDVVVVLDQDPTGVLTRILEQTQWYKIALSRLKDRPSN